MPRPARPPACTVDPGARARRIGTAAATDGSRGSRGPVDTEAASGASPIGKRKPAASCPGLSWGASCRVDSLGRLRAAAGRRRALSPPPVGLVLFPPVVPPRPPHHAFYLIVNKRCEPNIKSPLPEGELTREFLRAAGGGLGRSAGVCMDRWPHRRERRELVLRRACSCPSPCQPSLPPPACQPAASPQNRPPRPVRQRVFRGRSSGDYMPLPELRLLFGGGVPMRRWIQLPPAGPRTRRRRKAQPGAVFTTYRRTWGCFYYIFCRRGACFT